MKTISRALLIILFTTAAAVAQTKATDNGWPRKFAAGNNNVAIYQPQIEEWTGNSFAARAAIAITQNSSKQPLYGVLWFTARAEIDKVNRLVTLSDFKVKKINIPLAPDKAAAFEVALQARAAKQDEVIALDRLLADMAINDAATNNAAYEVRNDPPQVFFSTRPAILVLIDGAPVFRPIRETRLQRVINTRVLVVRDPASGKFYLHLMDGWLEAQDLAGPWTIAGLAPADLKRTPELASNQVDLLNSAKLSLAEAVLQNAVPTIFTKHATGGVVANPGRTASRADRGNGTDLRDQYRKRHLRSHDVAGALHSAFRTLVQVAIDAWPVAKRAGRQPPG